MHDSFFISTDEKLWLQPEWLGYKGRMRGVKKTRKMLWGQYRWEDRDHMSAGLCERQPVWNYTVVAAVPTRTLKRRRRRKKKKPKHTFMHANSDIMLGCPLCFIIKARSDCTRSEGENMKQIKQIVWCVKDRHSSSKVLKLLLPMDWQGERAREGRSQ